METPKEVPPPQRHVILGTISFAVCFLAWGLLGAFAPRFREHLGLDATRTGLLVAVPVILGALARFPMGLLADRYGARRVFTILMVAVAVPVAAVPAAPDFRSLLLAGFLLGLAGASFPVGVDYVSRWTPASRQGSALGVYGLGNIGQSAAVFLGPLAAAAFGLPAVFRGTAALLVGWGVVFGLLARDAPQGGPPKGIRPLLEVMADRPRVWVLAAFYFLTFGGFVAFSIYLPSLLRDQFGLPPADAGFRAAGFVVLATGMRPVGGWLADRIGGGRVLSGVFFGAVPFALLLAWPSMVPFTVGALGSAALFGLGNGAVFKLVPQVFPEATGTAGGLVGAVGGLGGFFPPLLLGAFRDRLGAVWPGFVLLAATSGVLGVVNHRVFVAGADEAERALPPELARLVDRARAAAWASLWTGLLAAAIVVGSRNLRHFDAALVVYTFAVLFATWGVVYHYSVWLRKPPTRRFWVRGFRLLRERGVLPSLLAVARTAASHLVLQSFIRRRSPLRWWMHQALFWGCLLAVAITFPLVFGWVHFETPPSDLTRYTAFVFGFPAFSFPIDSVTAWALFHGLDISAVLVLAGIALSLWRRMREQGALALQQFGADFMPLLLLFAVSVTGLALTASTLWLRGSLFPFLAILHAVTVVGTLLYLPFGKLFHVFQRPAQIGVKLYQRAGDEGPGALCARCGQRFASAMHVEDLREVLRDLGFDYAMPGPAGHWQALCPACKRCTLAAAQLRIQEKSRG